MNTNKETPDTEEPEEASEFDLYNNDSETPETESDQPEQSEGAPTAESEAAQAAGATASAEASAEGATATSPTDGGKPAQSSPTTSLNISAEELKKLLGQSAGQTQQSGQSTQKQLTKEEVEELLKTPKVSKAHLERLGFEEPTDEQVAVLNELILGAAEHAVRRSAVTANHMLRQELSKYEQPFNEMLQTHVVSEQRKAEQIFYSEYPALSEHKDVVQMAANALMQDPEMAKKSDAEIKPILVNQVAKILQRFNPNFSVTAKPSAPAASPPSKGNVPTMASHTSGGRSQSPQTTGGESPSEFDIYS